MTGDAAWGPPNPQHLPSPNGLCHHRLLRQQRTRSLGGVPTVPRARAQLASHWFRNEEVGLTWQSSPKGKRAVRRQPKTSLIGQNRAVSVNWLRLSQARPINTMKEALLIMGLFLSVEKGGGCPA